LASKTLIHHDVVDVPILGFWIFLVGQPETSHDRAVAQNVKEILALNRLIAIKKNLPVTLNVSVGVFGDRPGGEQIRAIFGSHFDQPVL
jgi:hypothetical protein